MLNFIKNHTILADMSEDGKKLLAGLIGRRCSGNRIKSHISYNLFVEWLAENPGKAFSLPVNIGDMRKEIHSNILCDVITHEIGFMKNSFSGNDQKILANLIVSDFVEAGFFNEFVLDEDILEHIPFGKRHDLYMPVVVNSSNGDVIADRKGFVVSVDNGWRETNAAIPARFDFDEYERHYDHPLPEHIDILDLGFASWDGNIVKPAQDWRELIKRWDAIPSN